MRRGALSLLLAASACVSPSSGGAVAGPGAASTADARVEGIVLEQRSHRPSMTASPRYASPVEHSLSAPETELLRAISTARFEHDPALSRMMRGLAAATPSRNDMPPELVDGLLAWNGIADPPPLVMVVEVNPDPEGCDRTVADSCRDPMRALAEEVASALSQPGNWYVGVGIAKAESGATRMMVGALDRGLELEPLAAEVARGKSFALEGRVIGQRSRPEVHLVDAGGGWQKVPLVRASDGVIRAKLSCGHESGVYKVEVFANGAHGPEVVANFPVYCGVRRPDEIDYTLERVGPKVSADAVAKANFAELNAARAAAGLSPLAWDEKAARLARAHSEDMVRSGFVGHISPTTGDAAQRFAKAGVATAIVRENIGRGYGPHSIHLSLMNSPGHRANLLADDVTHVGIGVVYGPPEGTGASAPRPIFLTQKFYAAAGQDAPDDPVAALRSGVDAQLRAAGAAALRWDDQLSEVAQAHAERLAAGKSGLAEAELRRRVFGLGYASMVQHRVESASFRGFTSMDLWREAGTQAVGFGLARTPKGEKFVLVLFFAS